MREVLEHPAYKLVKRYGEGGMVIDYVILENDTDEVSYKQHERVAIKGMEILEQRCREWALNKINHDVYCKGKELKDFFLIEWKREGLIGIPYLSNQFFAIPTDTYYISKPKVANRGYSMDDFAEYAMHFLEPPYGNK